MIEKTVEQINLEKEMEISIMIIDINYQKQSIDKQMTLLDISLK